MTSSFNNSQSDLRFLKVFAHPAFRTTDETVRGMSQSSMESEQRQDVDFASRRSRGVYPDQEQPALLTPSSRGRT